MLKFIITICISGLLNFACSFPQPPAPDVAYRSGSVFDRENPVVHYSTDPKDIYHDSEGRTWRQVIVPGRTQRREFILEKP